MRYVRFELNPSAFAHVSSQFGLYSFLEYENDYGSNFVSAVVVPQILPVLIAFLAA